MSPARDALRETFAELDAIRRAERRAVMATLVAAQGTTPRKEGAKMWVGAEGRVLVIGADWELTDDFPIRVAAVGCED